MNKFFSFFIGVALFFPGIAVSQNLTEPIGHTEIDFGNNVTSRSGEFGEIITTAPEGITKKLVRSGCAYCVKGTSHKIETYHDMMSEIVYCDNGEVYLKNPISHLPTGSYVKGYKEGNTLIFDLPQAIYIDDWENREMILTTLQYSEDFRNYVAANSSFSEAGGCPAIENKWVININEDGSYSYLPNIRPDGYAATMIGMVYSDRMSWNGFAEIYSDWTLLNSQTVNVPSGIEESTAEIHSGNNSYVGGVAFDGNDVYIRGLFNIMTESWIKGKRNGDKISFSTGQYLGEAPAYNYYAYLVTGQMVTLDNGNYDVEMTDSIIFTYDEENMTLTTGEDQVVVCNAGTSEIVSMNYIISPSINIQAANISKTPANPYNLGYVDWWDWGLNVIRFSIPDTNVDGILLDPRNLYYKVFFDDEEFTFYEDEYSVSESMTLVPYGFVCNNIRGNGQDREIYIFFEGADSFGIQLYYIVDGEILGESELISKQISVGIDPNIATETTVISTSYYDMSGREVDASFKGIRMKTVKFADGTVRTFKEINR